MCIRDRTETDFIICPMLYLYAIAMGQIMTDNDPPRLNIVLALTDVGQCVQKSRSVGMFFIVSCIEPV